MKLGICGVVTRRENAVSPQFTMKDGISSHPSTTQPTIVLVAFES